MSDKFDPNFKFAANTPGTNVKVSIQGKFDNPHKLMKDAILFWGKRGFINVEKDFTRDA